MQLIRESQMRYIQPFLFGEYERKYCNLKDITYRRILDFYIGYMKFPKYGGYEPIIGFDYFADDIKEVARIIGNTNLMLEECKFYRNINIMQKRDIHAVSGRYLTDYGSRLFLRKDIRQKIADYTGGDYLVVPSSSTCIAFTSTRWMDDNDMLLFAEKVKPQGNETNCISRNVYKYSAESDKLTIVG